MPEQFNIVDGNAIENLFTAAGERGWNLLKDTVLRIVIPDLVIDELRGIPPFLDAQGKATAVNTGRLNPSFGLADRLEVWISQQASVGCVISRTTHPQPHAQRFKSCANLHG